MEKLTSSNLKGNWATLLLATDSEGRLDMARLSDEMDVLIASSPDGIYSNGTACEFYSQSMEEFVTISEMLASKCTAAGVAFQIGVSHPCAQTSLERLRLVTPLKPGAIQVILPDWFPVSDDEAVVFLSEMERNADGIPLVLYNPPHAKRVLKPEGWQMLKRKVPSLTGVKVFDENCSEEWYGQMRANSDGISVFVPGHHLATGVKNGASGAYSNVACLNPTAAQKWYDMICNDMESALELESRIRKFMSECIDPFIVEMHYPNHACDRFMALAGGWADVGSRLRWPYRSIPEKYVPEIRKRAHDIIPEFI